jgi:hypothetical protein
MVDVMELWMASCTLSGVGQMSRRKIGVPAESMPSGS